MVIEEGAFEQARQLDHGWIGPEHHLLAILATPNVASDALADVGITYGHLRERLGSLRYDPDIPTPRFNKARKGVSPNPAANKLIGCARGFAVSAGLKSPRPEHWLIAMLYLDCRGAMWLQAFGVSARAAVDALASRGVCVPELAPIEYQPWRGQRTVYVSKKELQPIPDLLIEKHPPGSGLKWGFNWVGKPRRGRISTEEGIDLDAIVAQVRPQKMA